MKSDVFFFSREKFLARLSTEELWDVIIIGGGATGVGSALDAASRGYKVLLLEQSDFAKGTSSRSTKLVHGGVRYLAQGNISLVYQSLKERGILMKNAPHIVKKLPFIIPCYSWCAEFKYWIGLKLYDWMSGSYSFGKSEYLAKQDIMALLPGIKSIGLKGGVKYSDGQFDDARLALNIAQTCAEKGGTLLNYVQVTRLLKGDDGKINGVIANDLENKQEYRLRCKSLVNATGVFVNEILDMDTQVHKPLVKPSQGIHLVVNKRFLHGDQALLIPKTRDGRVLFAVPWQNHVLLGTTDTPIATSSLDPIALEEEIDFILKTIGDYLVKAPARRDILSIFAGLRPLAATAEGRIRSTKDISRCHKILTSKSGLITVTGGKWTMYRRMAEETIDQVIKLAGLQPVGSATASLKIHGFINSDDKIPLSIYGSDQEHIQALIAEAPHRAKKLHERLPYIQAEVVWAVHHEMARTIDDVLARRLRALFLDARAAIEMAPLVASIMAKELNFDVIWEKDQVTKFTSLANQYLPDHYSSDEPVKRAPVTKHIQ